MMFTLSHIAGLLVLAAAGAWLWHNHGLRELALLRVTRHCEKLDISLLDGNVAFQRFAWVADSRGHKRFARLYNFEFTVTGEQRLTGRITLFGRHVGRIELDPHPFTESEPAPVIEAKVIDLDQWRREHHS